MGRYTERGQASSRGRQSARDRSPRGAASGSLFVMRRRRRAPLLSGALASSKSRLAGSRFGPRTGWRCETVPTRLHLVCRAGLRCLRGNTETGRRILRGVGAERQGLSCSPTCRGVRRTAGRRILADGLLRLPFRPQCEPGRQTHRHSESRLHSRGPTSDAPALGELRRHLVEGGQARRVLKPVSVAWRARRARLIR